MNESSDYRVSMKKGRYVVSPATEKTPADQRFTLDGATKWADDANRSLDEAIARNAREAEGAPNAERFERAVRAAEGVYYRRDKGYTTGRNAAGSDATLAAHVGAARELLFAAARDEADLLPEYLDAKPRLAARWAAVERRFYGLEV